jgi:hypothetical protein
MRLAGNVIWARPLIEKKSEEKAGKGGGGQTVVSYEYFATFAVAFASPDHSRRLRGAAVVADVGRI